MSGGNLFAYSAITTKIRAMQSNLLTEEQFDDIAHCQTVADAFFYLQKTAAYHQLFADIDPATIHRGQIEWLLNFSTYEDFSKIYHFAQKQQKKYLNLYFMRYEILTLKRYMRSVLDPRQETGVSIIENDFEKHSRIQTKKVAESANMNEFIENLKGTIYYECLAKVNTLERSTLFDYEMALDMFYFSTLWKQKDSLFCKSERNFITRSYGSRIDLLNILWIYRCKAYYTVPPTAMYTFLLPIHYRLKNAEMKQMVEAETADDVLEIASGTYYGRKYHFSKDTALEEQCQKIIGDIIAKDFKQAPYSLAAINAYFHYKNAESAKIVTALECLRYGYSPERIKQYINRKGSGV